MSQEPKKNRKRRAAHVAPSARESRPEQYAPPGLWSDPGLQESIGGLEGVPSDLRQKIHELEKNYREITSLFSETDLAVLLLDEGLRIKCFTPHAARLLPLLGTDIGRPITDFAAKIANEHLIDSAQDVLETRTPCEIEVWSDDEEPRCYLRRIVPHANPEKGLQGVVITFVDITERVFSEADLEKEIEERTAQLAASRVRLDSVVKTVAEAIVVIDSDGKIEFFNPFAEEMFGYLELEVLGQNVKMLMSTEHSKKHDEYISSFLRTGIAKIIGSGREVEGRRKNGTLFPIALAVSKMESDGEIRFVGTMRDLTKEREARSALDREHALNQSMISTVRAIILRLDQDGCILSFNPYTEELLGYSLEEVRGKNWIENFVPEYDQERISGVLRHSLDGTKTEGNINPILTSDGREVLIEWHDDELSVPGEPYTLLAVGIDVTAREQYQREFLQAQKMEAVGRLAGGVAHDFNNLLAGIIGGVRIAAEHLEEEHPARVLLNQVQDEVERGSSITRRLLDFSRVGKPKLTWTSLHDTIGAGEKMMRRLIGEDIEMCFECDGSQSRILADPTQVEQAVLNIAINARDAMPDGGRLTLYCHDELYTCEDFERLGVTLAPGAFTVLSVIDTGCGMDEATRMKASEAFFTTKDPGMGTGLGLSSVHSMMEQVGGQLVIESKPEVGTTVHLIFPGQAIDDEDRPEISESPTTLPPGSGETIMIVEDEILVRMGTQHVLEKLGYRVVALGDSLEAKEKLAESPQSYQLLLTDIVLPKMSGPELAAAAKDQNPGLEVLFMSAFPTADLISRGKIPLGTTTLEKPFSDEDLAVLVHRALSRA